MFRFYVWDAEWAFGHQRSCPDLEHRPQSAFEHVAAVGFDGDSKHLNGLKASPEFRLRFADRVHRHLFNGGRLDRRPHTRSLRGGQGPRSNAVSGFDDRIGTVWIPQRRSHLLNISHAASFLASANAPVFNQFGGRVPAGWELEMSSAQGEIHYTTDGSDPRVVFSGAVAPAALRFSVPVRLEATTRIKARALNGATWSALTEAVFEVAQVGWGLEIAEIMYHPAGGEDYEFLEIANTGSVAVELASFTLEGSISDFRQAPARSEPDNGWFWPRAVIPRRLRCAIPRWRWAVISKGISRTMESVWRCWTLPARRLRRSPIPTRRPGPYWQMARGPRWNGCDSRVIRMTRRVGRPARVWEGRPEWGTLPELVSEVVLNEVMAVNVLAVPRGIRYPDWVELHNRGSASVDLAGWSLSDNADIHGASCSRRRPSSPRTAT